MRTAVTFALLASLAAPALAAELPKANGKKVLYLYGYIDANGKRPGDPAYNNDPFHPMRLDNVDPGAPNQTDYARGMSEYKKALEEVGFNVSQQIDSAITLTDDSLKPYHLLILSSNNRLFSAEEAKALNTWVKAGGGVIAWSDSAFGGDWQKVGVANETGRNSDNSLTEQFGLRFLTDGSGDYSTPGKDNNPGPDNKKAGEGIHAWQEKHFINNFETDGTKPEGLTFYGEGVSFVRVLDNSGATILAKLQNPPGANPTTPSPGDGGYDPQRDAALAINQIGKGRVVGIFDRNLFWNDGEGTDIFEVDNRELAQRTALWAANVPEPATISLLALATPLLLRRKRPAACHQC